MHELGKKRDCAMLHATYSLFNLISPSKDCYRESLD